MSDVFGVSGLLKQAGVTVLAGLLLSSAVLAEDGAEAAGGLGEETPVDVVVVEVDTTEPTDEVLMVTTEAPVDEAEVVDPICAECSGEPEISIDPIEMVGEPVEDGTDETSDGTVEPVMADGEVIDMPVEIMQNAVPEGRPSMPEARGDSIQSVSRGDHGEGAVVRSASGETPGWLKKLFKSN